MHANWPVGEGEQCSKKRPRVCVTPGRGKTGVLGSNPARGALCPALAIVQFNEEVFNVIGLLV